MDNIQFDDAKLTDIPALIELLNELFSIEKDFKPDADKQFRGLKMLIESPATGTIKVVRDSQAKAVGMVSAQLVISTAQGAPSAWVEDMIISEAYRASGVGKKLLTEAIAWAKSKGATRAQLLVDIENEPALGYYAHLGWQTTQLQARKVLI
ncbi:MAG: GNAT family N-acetyltransferase [Methylophilaceae bacterium]|nr:GNAT family N-acetyltransferase [Methyloradius sp.]